MRKAKHNQENEIIWNIVNALLAGSLVLLGSFTSGNITLNSLFFAVIAGAIVAISQFKDYWVSEKTQFTTHFPILFKVF